MWWRVLQCSGIPLGPLRSVGAFKIHYDSDALVSSLHASKLFPGDTPQHVQSPYPNLDRTRQIHHPELSSARDDIQLPQTEKKNLSNIRRPWGRCVAVIKARLLIALRHWSLPSSCIVLSWTFNVWWSTVLHNYSLFFDNEAPSTTIANFNYLNWARSSRTQRS